MGGLPPTATFTFHFHLFTFTFARNEGAPSCCYYLHCGNFDYPVVPDTANDIENAKDYNERWADSFVIGAWPPIYNLIELKTYKIYLDVSGTKVNPWKMSSIWYCLQHSQTFRFDFKGVINLKNLNCFSSSSSLSSSLSSSSIIIIIITIIICSNQRTTAAYWDISSQNTLVRYLITFVYHHVLPYFTMFSHVLPCFTIFYHVWPCLELMRKDWENDDDHVIDQNDICWGLDCNIQGYSSGLVRSTCSSTPCLTTVSSTMARGSRRRSSRTASKSSWWWHLYRCEDDTW